MQYYNIKYYNNTNNLLYQYNVECEDKDEAVAHAENHLSSGIPDRYEVEELV